jgi:hypothetical protein
MKVSELFEESKPDYFRRLEDELNIKRLGSGAFARVFQHPTHPEVVVKIFTDEDLAYKKYLKFCLANQGNKYVPKILSVHKHDHDPKKPEKDLSIDEIVDNRYTLVFMEKLQPAKLEDLRAFIRAAPFESQELKDKQSKPYSFIVNLNSFDSPEWQDLAKQTSDKELATIAKFFTKILRDEEHALDLHDRNVMMRGSQLVFTDPTS